MSQEHFEDTSARLVRLESKMEDNVKTTWRIFEAVYGNGKPGLITQIQNIQAKLDAATAHKADWKWVISTLIAVAALVAAFKGAV